MSAYNWATVLDRSYLELDEKPQFGFEQAGVEKLQQHLRSVLKRDDLTIKAREIGWQKGNAVFEGIGEKILPLTFYFSPLKSPIYFITSEQDIAFFLQELMESKEAATPFVTTSYIQGFYQFLALELLSGFEKLEIAEGLSLRLADNPPSLHAVAAEQDFFSVDVSCQLQQTTLHGRVLLSTSFRKEWKRHFFAMQKIEIAPEMKAKLFLELSFVAGFSHLSVKDWKSVKKGDLLVLDRVLIDAEKKTGKVILQVNGKPFLRGKWQENGIKLLEHPMHEEVFKSMDEDDEDFEEESFLEEEIEEPLVEEAEAEEEEERVTVAPVEPQEKFEVEQLPVVVCVEVARIKMSLEELSKLSPGNLLDIHIAPEQGVSLVINDKTVGRGELVKVGDVLGVRIS